MDDSPEFLTSATALLTMQGITVVGRAVNAFEAVEVASSTRPDVTLVDVELGADEGVELAAHLTAKHLTGQVILVSVRDWAQVTAAGPPIAGFIRKDRLDARTISELLARATASQRRPQDRFDQSLQLAALRRVAGVVAGGADALTVVRSVADETATLLGIEAVGVARYNADTRTLTKVYGTHGDRSAAFDGASWPLEMSPEFVLIMETGGPARYDAWAEAGSIIAERHQAQGFGTALAAPIMVDGVVWGGLAAYARAGQVLPAGLEHDLADFTGLMSTAIANVEARALAETQGALRRVAILVAQGREPHAVFTAVAHEASALLRVNAVSLIRYDPAAGMLTKIYGTHGHRSPVPDGTTWPVTDSPEAEQVVRTGRPSRIDDWTEIPGSVADWHRAGGFGGSVAAPIMIDGALWGVLAAYAESDGILPPRSESDLADFTTLIASAIANADARDELRGSAERQGQALRRVATLVAQRATSATVFAAVAAEAQRALSVMQVEVCRSRADGAVTFLGSTDSRGHSPIAERVARSVIATGTTVRRDLLPAEDDPDAVTDSTASVVGAPIRVDDRAWGVIVVLDRTCPAPDIENRLADFTHLVAGSIANVRAREELLASRARIVTASDETRRRIERNLHDGVQQRLVALGLRLRVARARFPLPPGAEQELDEVVDGLETAQEEIRVFAQGLHPVLLSRSGLGPALRDLARRSPMPVDLRVQVGRRYPESVESAVYYVVSEALTNVAKHADAGDVSVEVEASDVTIRARITDDGSGGASLERGSGLIGLVDRVEAAGGNFTVASPPGRGTTITIEIPLAGAR